MYKFKVDNMNCKSCIRNIDDLLKELDSSSELSADLQRKELEIKSRASIENITEELEKAGYKVVMSKRSSASI